MNNITCKECTDDPVNATARPFEKIRFVLGTPRDSDQGLKRVFRRFLRRVCYTVRFFFFFFCTPLYVPNF